MQKPLLIALTGQARSGKSTAAAYISYKYDLERLSFSREIKRIAEKLFPYMLDGGKPRSLYQKIGQKMREIDPEVWIKQTEEWIAFEERYKDYKGVVIDDLRQPNEYKWAREKGFSIIRINANEDTRIKRANIAGDRFDTKDMHHETELYVDDFEVDYEISNDGKPLEDLHAEIDAIMEDLKAGI